MQELNRARLAHAGASGVVVSFLEKTGSFFGEHSDTLYFELFIVYFECILMYFAGNTPKYTSPRDTPKYTQNTLEYNLYSGRAKHEYTTNGEYISEAQIYIRNFRYNKNTIVFCILTGARIHCIRHEDNYILSVSDMCIKYSVSNMYLILYYDIS